MILTTPTPNRSLVDLQEARARHRQALDLIASRPRLRGMLQLTEDGRTVMSVLNLIPVLCAEIERLSRRIDALRLDHANLTAAAHATLSAHREGEPDPLYYLRDELSAEGPPPAAPAATGRYRYPYPGGPR
ncbi:hypothetical protein GT755_11945 [Herbidospora sp. NEAU-GS84]|uniref:Uncharacterized protein n=1 Tax=Herbidospora solisilvae TaxID=2696284 RepID=A0A7C9N2I7_9ACTN|nr:hypothetical protein [Herbidospora solisilvae]NAS22394.1 hypothetical protein [Herbidospora solisilvae]